MADAKKTGRAEVRIRASRYAVLAEYAKLTGVSMEAMIDEALTEYLAEHPAQS